MEILGYILATLIGLSLGVMGGGGSILTVPILVYVLKFDPKQAIALSLAIVGATSLIGSFGHYKKGNINLKVAYLFGPFAMIGTYLGAKLSAYISGSAQLIFFAIIMIIASYFMFKGRSEDDDIEEVKKLNISLIIAEGIIVGIVTGIVGVGGGFLIVPALVLLAGIKMKQAVGTSLLIISLKSFSGFYGYLNQVEVPWQFLGIFVIFTAIGILIGNKLVDHISNRKLKKGFAIFLVIMGIFILYKNRDQLNFAGMNISNNEISRSFVA